CPVHSARSDLARTINTGRNGLHPANVSRRADAAASPPSRLAGPPRYNPGLWPTLVKVRHDDATHDSPLARNGSSRHSVCDGVQPRPASIAPDDGAGRTDRPGGLPADHDDSGDAAAGSPGGGGEDADGSDGTARGSPGPGCQDRAGD